MKNLPLLLLALFALSFTSACTKQSRPPMVQDVKTTDAGLRVSVAPAESTPSNATTASKPEEGKAKAITAEITLQKSEILGKQFLYGADLQYSSMYDEDFDLYNQSMAIGHIPVYFKINGKELQLIEDASRSFPSDVNHPDRLVSRYKILAETEQTLTVSDADSSEFLTSNMIGSQKSPKDRWTRSLEFVKDGSLVLQETSVLMADGSVVEMMESVMPRESLTPTAGFQAIQMDPTDPTGGLQGELARYRLLSGETIRKGEEKLAFAQHFDISDGKTIDWYVTSNIKDEHLPVVRDAILGWNRYFKTFAGIEREVIRFMGRLPEGVKLGDPRYNVINWDSRLVAGAAYESQASDPFTGKQSHSLIYMPVAWFQIGKDYWNAGKYSDKMEQGGASAGKAHAHTNMFRNRCMRDLKAVGEALDSGRMSRDEAEKFALQLMKGTLFHEVGHALGLAHNFKGSLSFDRSKADSIFSNSIMDYNDYEIERQVFKDDSSEGPLLEYDRQVLSALYNNMKDVKASDPRVAVCNDAEADTEEAGAVDPTCMRYDIEKDPTLSIETALKRLKEDALEGDVSLVQALQNMQKMVLSEEAIQAVNSEEALMNLLRKLASDMTGVLRFYHLSGKASLVSTVRSNLKSLRPFIDESIGDLSELGMRTRALNGLKATLEMKRLSENVQRQILALAEAAGEEIKKSPFALATGGGDAIATNVKVLLSTFGKRFERDSRAGLPRVRSAILARLGHVEGLPFFFGNTEGTELDIESQITGILAQTAGDLTASMNERLYAARSLKTFSGRPGVNAMISNLKSQIERELKSARSHDEREVLILMQRLLGEV